MSSTALSPRTARPALSAVLVTVLASLSFVEPLGTDVYLPAFPRLAADLGATPSGVQLTLTAFMIGLATGHLVFGPLSDRYGRRLPLLAGTAATAVAGAACALAPDLEWLIVFRAVQGFSAASGFVIARSVVTDLADGPRAARLFSLLMALLGIAPIAAPLAGGAILAIASWRTIFWVLAAAMALLAVAVAVAVPETLPRESRRARGFAATAAGVRAVVTNRRYLAYTLAFSLTFGALFCYIATSSFLYQGVFGLSYVQNSWAVAGTVLVHSATAMSSARLVSRISSSRIVHIGLAAMLFASVCFVVVASSGGLSLAVALALLAVFFVGTGLVMPHATSVALDGLAESAGTGSAFLGTLQNGAAAVSAPLAGLVGGALTVSMSAAMTAFVVLAIAALLIARNIPAARTRQTPRRTNECLSS